MVMENSTYQNSVSSSKTLKAFMFHKKISLRSLRNLINLETAFFHAKNLQPQSTNAYYRMKNCMEDVIRKKIRNPNWVELTVNSRGLLLVSGEQGLTGQVKMIIDEKDF